MQDLQSPCWLSSSSKHLMEQADWGGSAPYWLEAAQLEVSGSWPVGLQRSLPPSETTHSTQTYASQFGLITHNCCLPCCFCCCEQQHLGDLSRVQAWARCMEILGCPVIDPSLSLTSVVQMTAEHYIWHWLGCRTCQKEVEVDNPTTLGGPLLVIPWGLLLKPFPWLDVAARQQRFEIRVFLLDELPAQAKKLHLPKATGF